MPRDKHAFSRSEQVALALAVAIAHLFYWRIVLHPSSFDALHYQAAAAHVADHGVFSNFSYSSVKTYGYPLFLSVLLRIVRTLGGTSTGFSLLIFEVQLGLYIAAAGYLRGALLTRAPSLARLVFAALALNVFVLSYAPESLTESLSASLATLASGMWLRLLLGKDGARWWMRLVLGSMVVGFSVMIRPANLFVVGAWSVAILAAFVARRTALPRALLAIGVAFGAVGLPMLPQIANNVAHHGKATPLLAASLGRYQQVWGIRNLKYATALPPVPTAGIFYENPLAEDTTVAEHRPLSWYLAYPGRGALTLALHSFNMLDQDLLFTYSRDLDPWYRIPIGILNHSMVAMALLGCSMLAWRAVSRRDREVHCVALTLLAYVVCHVVVHASTLVEMRFGLPLLLLASPLAAWTGRVIWYDVPGRGRTAKMALVALYVAVALGVSTWVRWQSPAIRAWEVSRR